jgi:serine/threonine-protein kinase
MLVLTAGAAEAGSQLGRAMGTPAYMSPEQAAGRWDAVGLASDVYSLGATLYQLLTGQAPFAGDPGILERVQRGDFPRPRAVKPAVPPALEAVCLKAMARQPEGRYAGALELAAEVEHWLADEPVTAYREPLPARLRRWARRHRSTVAATAAALVVMAVLSGLGGWWLQRQVAEQRRAGVTALDRAAELRQEERWKEERAVLDQARTQLGGWGQADLRQRLEQARADLDLVDRLDAIRLNKATIVEGKLDLSGTDQEYAAVFQELGLATEGEEAQRVADRVRASGVRDQIVAALDDWANAAGGERRTWLLDITRRADPDEGRDLLRDPQAWPDREAMKQLLADGKVKVSELTVPLLSRVAGTLSGPEGGGVELLKQAQRLRPNDFWINLALGVALYSAGKPAQAVGYYRAALVLRPRTATLHLTLGTFLGSAGQVDDAVAECRRAVELDQNYAMARLSLGAALANKGQVDDALAELRRAIDLGIRSATAHRMIGAILWGKNQLDGACTELRLALELEPDNAAGHRDLGMILMERGQLPAALFQFGKAAELERKRGPNTP